MYNKRYKKSNKKIYGMCTIIVLLIYTISICYSTLQQQLEINGLVKVRRQENIRVTGVEVESSPNATSNWEEYDVKNVSAGISLPNEDSSITYKVKVTNFGNVDMGIYNIDGLDNRLTYTIEGYELKDKIEKSGNKREFKITIKYKDGSYDASNTDYNILLNFEFRAYYKVTYKNFPSGTDNLPKEVMERDKLIVDLKDYQNARYKITENEITLPSDRYTYINNELTISSVEGDIEITYKKIPDIELVLRDNDSNKTLSEDIQAGMYRYQGSYEQVKNNYICFGTSSKDECLNNKDKYMYRIIGITEDGQLELIKMTALNDTGVPWNSVYRTTWNEDVDKNEKTKDANIPWSQSDLYKRLNGLSSNTDNLFIGNNTYEYLNESSPWYNKIADTNWLSGALRWDAESFKLENIYQIETGQKEAPYDEEESPYYYNGGIETISEEDKYTERRSEDGVKCAKYDNDYINKNKVTCYKLITKRFENKITSKIGLMHVYEFDYSVQKDGLDCFYDNVNNKPELQTCKNSWMHISNNDTTINGNDWTMSNYGFVSSFDSFNALDVDTNGYVDNRLVHYGAYARPVFYLTPDIIIKEGTTGTKDNPYIIDMYKMNGYIDDLSGNNKGVFINKDNVIMTNEGINININNDITTNISPKDLSNTFSIVVRFKVNESLDVSVDGYHCIFNSGTAAESSVQKYHALNIMYGNNILRPYTEFGYGESHINCFGNNIEKNKFYTITIIYDNKNIKFYNNGKLEKTEYMTPEWIIPSYNYRLRALNTFSDFLVYDRVLTDDEISANFGETINVNNINKKNLLLYYKFD